MAIYSIAANTQEMSPEYLYHLASLNQSVVALERKDIANWNAATLTAIGQDLAAVGWGNGTRVAIVVDAETIYYTTLTSAVFSGGNTLLTFADYGGAALISQKILNLDYLNYAFKLNLDITTQVGTAVTETDTVILYPSPGGWAFFDICEYLRDYTMRKKFEIKTYGATLTTAPIKSEAVVVEMSVQCVANGETTVSTWDGNAGDTAIVRLFRMREIELAASGEVVAPSILQTAINISTETVGGRFMWEPGAEPLIRAAKSGANYTVPVCLPFHLAGGFVLYFNYGIVGAGTPADVNVTYAGNYYIFDKIVTTTIPQYLQIDKDPTDESNLIPLTLQIDAIPDACGEIVQVVWRNSVGGWNWWTFANDGGTSVVSEVTQNAGEKYAASLPAVTDSLIRNQPALNGGTWRTLPTDRAKVYRVEEKHLKVKHLLYLRSLLTTEEAYIVLDQDFFPISIEEGAAEPIGAPKDLYSFNATIKMPL